MEDLEIRRSRVHFWLVVLRLRLLLDRLGFVGLIGVVTIPILLMVIRDCVRFAFIHEFLPWLGRGRGRVGVRQPEGDSGYDHRATHRDECKQLPHF